MAINIKFDSAGNPEAPTIILATRSGDKLGQLHIDEDSIDLTDVFNDASEISFTVNKYNDGKITNLWDKIIDFKLVWCKEWDLWFQISVELDEATETVKTVFCKQLGQSELSQINLYDIEINTEKDIERDDYKITILYDKYDKEASLLDRLLKDKAPHYSIIHVDSTIANLQRSFSFNGINIYDAFQEISKEIGCLFVFNSNSDKDGKIQRTISVYDLMQNCSSCGHRGEYTDVCPKCGSTSIVTGYGEDTLIFVTADELASSGIELTTDTDSVKNCFRLEAGDDLMTATVRNCNPNGTSYIWRLSDITKEDMSEELVNKLKSYDETYQNYYNSKVFNLDSSLLSKYNNLITKYTTYNEDLKTIKSPITGYSNLMNAYYNTIDLELFLNSGLMPSVEISETNATEQAKLLTASSLSPVAVADVDIVSLATANSAVLAMAKVIVKSTFKTEVNSSELTTSNGKKYWKGNFTITNYSDEEDVAESNQISIELNDDLETVTKQKIEKALTKEDTDNLSISGLFAREYDDFCTELKKYALNPLVSFYDACQVCIDILIEQGVADQTTWADNEEGSEGNLYEKLYLPYYDKLVAIEAEIKVREGEIIIVSGIYDSEGNLETDGLKTCIEKRRNEVQDALNFEKYLGTDLFLEFSAYRREDTYSNNNYISDGLNNSELFEKALEFIEVAENEIYKASETQYSISTTLNNLLAIEEFKPLVDSFRVGNWLRVQVNDELFKLRLLQYDISFGDFDNIPVVFSNVTKIKNGITDIESILSQASSMATSYDSIKRQSDQGTQAQGTINQWIKDGLNSALVRINSNNSEEVTLSKTGLLCRSYDDVTGTYSPEQYRLTHNIMAYTTDNWKTVSAALGKHDYTKWVNNSWVKDTDYGLTATFVTAGYVTGSQIIGGEIVSSNYVPSKSGTYFNLIDGNFELAGGKFTYNNIDSKLSIKDVAIDWSTSTNPDIEHVIGLTDSLNGLSTRITINKNSITSEVARATEEEGKLSSKITQTATEIRSEVKKADDSLSSRITQNANSITSEVTRAKDAEETLSSKITQNANNIELKVSKGSIISTINQSAESVTINANKISLAGKTINLTSDGIIIKSTYFNVTKDGVITATSGKIANWNITANTISKSTTKDGVDVITGMQQPGNGTYSFFAGTYNGSSYSNCEFKVTHKGKLYASGAVINGDSTFAGTLSGADGTFKGTLSAVSGSFVKLTAGKSSFSKNQVIIDASYVNTDGEEVAKGSVYIGRSGIKDWEDITIRPSSNNIGNIGTSSTAWDTLWVKNGAIQSSDRNYKTDITVMGEKQERLFDLLSPVTFKFIDSTFDRYHYGFISQEVEDAIFKAGLTTKDFAGFCKNIKRDENNLPVLDKDGNEEYVYSLRYSEFIALNTHMIKKLQVENNKLKERIDLLEDRLNKLS